MYNKTLIGLLGSGLSGMDGVARRITVIIEQLYDPVRKATSGMARRKQSGHTHCNHLQASRRYLTIMGSQQPTQTWSQSPCENNQKALSKLLIPVDQDVATAAYGAAPFEHGQHRQMVVHRFQ